MMRRFALRDRLALAFTLALVTIYAAFAVLLFSATGNTFESITDQQLHTVAEAVSFVIDVGKDGKFHPDAHDLQQFATISSGVSGTAMIDEEGGVVISTASEIPSFVRDIRAPSPERLFTARSDNHRFRILAVPFHFGPRVQATVVTWESYDLLRSISRELQFVILGFGVVVAVVAYMVGAQIARRGLAPLARMTAVIADIEAHDLTKRVGRQPHDDELGRLATTFDRMLDRLADAFARQKQFTADASHDLRAPLATLRAEIDLAMRRERTPAEYRSALAAMAKDADRLDELIDALLAAARSEAGEIALTPTDLAGVAQQGVERITAYAHAKHITIDTAFDGDATIAAEPRMLERAVIAVLHNAVKYTPDHATIHVRVENHNGSAHLRIRDEGPGFTEAALTHAFDRFWRDDSARGRSGSGLGLAIAKTIVDRFGGSVSLANDPAGGGTVEAIFPRLS